MFSLDWAHVTDLQAIAAANPEWLFAAVMLFAVMQEDLATATTALMAAQGHIDPVIGLLGVMAGIALGDLGLFALGWFARGHRLASHILAKHKVRRLRRFAKGNMISVILVTRCIPGMRLPTYFALGFFHASPIKFICVAILAVMMWSTLLFSTAYVVGYQVISALEGPWFWLGVAVFVGLVFVVPRFILARTKMWKDITQDDQPE